MSTNRIETAEFSGRVLMVGCGSIGQAMLPLLRRHLTLPEDGLAVLEASEQGRAFAAANQAWFNSAFGSEMPARFKSLREALRHSVLPVRASRRKASSR